MKKVKLTGVILAVGAAAAFALAPAVSNANTSHHGKSMVHCGGVNGCKGKSSCKGGDNNSCKGQNSCKGKGWVDMKASMCDQLGGTVEK